MIRGWCLVLLAAGSLGAVVAAHQRTQPQGPPPIFRATTHHVAVDVVVTDRDDRPVTDLTRDDFVIAQANRLQTIADFAFISVPLGNRSIDLEAPTAPPADVGANATSPRSSRAIVFVIDDTTIQPQDLVPLKRAMTGFLQTLTPDDQVALTYVVHSNLGQDFTNDIGRLIDAVNNRRVAVGLKVFSADRDRIHVLKNVVSTLASARQARRVIIFVSAVGCTPLPPDTVAAIQCMDLINLARRSNVPIYTLDPRVFTDPNSVHGIGNINSSDQAEGLRAASAAARDSMRTLAGATGARGFVGMSDVPRAVREIMTENGSYYLLGFYPDPVVTDGAFHEINVTVKRPGLRVRARRGYMAAPAKATPSTPKRDMTMALGAGLDDPSLPLRAFVAPLAAAPAGRTRAVVTIEVAYPLPETGANALDDELRVGILALTPDAKIKASFQRPIRFTGAWKPTARGAFVINELVDLPTEPLTVRVGVTSRALAQTGTTHVKVEVPDFRDNDLQLSPLVLGRNDEGADAASGLSLIRSLVPFQPTTARTFGRDDSLRVFARAFWKSRDDKIDVEMTVTRGASLPLRRFQVPGTLVATGQRQAVVDSTLPLRDLAAGAYVLRVRVHRPTGKPVTREVPFSVR